MVSGKVLIISAPQVADEIAATVADQVLGTLRRRGVVVGLSGGIDSSVVAALCTRALGKDRVLGLFMPEHDASPESLRLGQQMAAFLGIDTVVEDISATLEAVGCYRRQIEAIRTVFPDYGPGWKCKLTLPSLLERERLNVFRLVVESPGGERYSGRLPPAAFLQLVAATNFKQRTRKMMEYYHADRLQYAVAGTPNLLEYRLGFFVKQGDGMADVKPIAHLYKTQVYALAEHLGVPDEIRRQTPSTDTYSLPQTQEEFFFALPYQRMDLCLWGHEHGVPPAELAPIVELTPDQVERVYRDIESKRRATSYLHAPPLFAKAVNAPRGEPPRGQGGAATAMTMDEAHAFTAAVVAAAGDRAASANRVQGA